MKIAKLLDQKVFYILAAIVIISAAYGFWHWRQNRVAIVDLYPGSGLQVGKDLVNGTSVSVDYVLAVHRGESLKQIAQLAPVPEAGVNVNHRIEKWLMDHEAELDLEIVDSTVLRKLPRQFVLGAGQVLPGIEASIQGLKQGGIRAAILPASLGYQDQSAGGGLVQPNSKLLLIIQLN